MADDTQCGQAALYGLSVWSETSASYQCVDDFVVQNADRDGGTQLSIFVNDPT